MELAHMNSRRFAVGKRGGEIRAVNNQGEIAWAIGLTAGVHDERKYLALLEPGMKLETSGDVTLLAPASGKVKRMAHPRASESGANPDYKPTLASSLERRLQHQIAQVNRRFDQKVQQMERASQERRAEKATQSAERANSEDTTPVAPEHEPELIEAPNAVGTTATEE